MPDDPATWTDHGVTPRLAGTRFGEVRWFAEIDSTNRYLLDRAAAGAPDGLVAVADVQTAGRGRLDRNWVATPGSSLLVSVLLRTELPPERLHGCSVAAMLAAADTLGRYGIEARAKWPNDLVVSDRKIAGLLAEARAGALVVGMGLNVDWPGFPPELADIATACNLESGAAPDRADLLVDWLHGLDVRLAMLVEPDAVVRQRVEHETRSATVGRRVRVEMPHEIFEGVAVELADSGHLVVVDDHGLRHFVAAGDVVHLRVA